jgi:hypothetical protein
MSAYHIKCLWKSRSETAKPLLWKRAFILCLTCSKGSVNVAYLTKFRRELKVIGDGDANAAASIVEEVITRAISSPTVQDTFVIDKETISITVGKFPPLHRFNHCTHT